jgi:hypothetical protein
VLPVCDAFALYFWVLRDRSRNVVCDLLNVVPVERQVVDVHE